MLRILTSASVVGLLLGCSAPLRPPMGYGDVNEQLASPSLDLASSPEPSPASDLTAPATPDFLLMPALATPALIDGRGASEGNYLTLKGGFLHPTEGNLDPGFITNAALGHSFNRFLAVEVEGGYAAPDPDSPADDLYLVPLMVNARVSVPIWLLEVYGGLGIGGMYYAFDQGVADTNGWLLAGNAFVGADVVLFDRLTAGLELKYYVTDKIRSTDDTLDSVAIMATLGWRF
jgi:Outer membrane protein beta-barrel domain